MTLTLTLTRDIPTLGGVLPAGTVVEVVYESPDGRLTLAIKGRVVLCGVTRELLETKND